MLVNSALLLQDARIQGKCIPAFNIYNLETITAAFLAARSQNTPVIVAFGEGYLSHASFQTISAIVHSLASFHSLSIVLHLDHCKELQNIYAAIEAGFTSVMYDGSLLPLYQNIENTRKVVAFAHENGVSVEGELGMMNPEDAEGEACIANANFYTSVHQADTYVKETGVDSLAVSIGNAHGLYKGIPNLDFTRLENIYKAVKIPIVLHGCSGIPDEQIRKAAAIAVAKINVNTELALAGTECVRKSLNESQNATVRFDKLMTAVQDEIQKRMEHFINLTWGN